VLIRSVSADGKEVAPAAQIAIPAGTRRVQIDYAALSLLDPDRVQFRYRLTGVDEDWVDPGSRRQATYTNVAPGHWTFQ
ncbi:triple tyrosine motif-containing protein, partial [Escherichia coli]|uniref:triple tyrosine motif-containing protein n=1 Tax=Escherichia coli TaxID=562 RepID=UPI003D363C14